MNNKVRNKKINEISMSLEFEFADPNNMNIDWFNDYHKETATFDAVYVRYLKHPNTIESRTQSAVFEYLYKKNKEEMFAEMYNNIGMKRTSKEAVLNEIAKELEIACGVVISKLSMNEKPTESDVDNGTWVLGFVDNLILRSPYMYNTEALPTLRRVVEGIMSRHFVSGSGAFRIYMKHTNFSELKWFKAIALFDIESIIDVVNRLPLDKRHSTATKMVKNPSKEQVVAFITKFMGNVKKTNIEISNTRIVLELGSGELYLDNDKTIFTWFGRMIFLLMIISDEEFYRKEYVEKIRYILKKTRIKK